MNRAWPALLFMLIPSTIAWAGIDISALPRDAHIDQRAGQFIPGDVPFNDESGDAVRLGDYFAKRPTLLVMVYFSCPDLCPMTLRHLVQGLNGIQLQAGVDFNAVIVSFDSHDTPAAAALQRREYIRGYFGRDAHHGWHFLTGAQPAIDRLKQAVGYSCKFDASQNRFAHATGVMVIAPGGKLTHYFFGVDYSPAELEAALHDSQAGRVTVVDQPFQQYCFQFDPAATGRGRIVFLALRAAGIAWIASLLGYIGVKLTREFRARRGREAVSS